MSDRKYRILMWISFAVGMLFLYFVLMTIGLFTSFVFDFNLAVTGVLMAVRGLLSLFVISIVVVILRDLYESSKNKRRL